MDFYLLRTAFTHFTFYVYHLFPFSFYAFTLVVGYVVTRRTPHVGLRCLLICCYLAVGLFTGCCYVTTPARFVTFYVYFGSVTLLPFTAGLHTRYLPFVTFWLGYFLRLLLPFYVVYVRFGYYHTFIYLLLPAFYPVAFLLFVLTALRLPHHRTHFILFLRLLLVGFYLITPTLFCPFTFYLGYPVWLFTCGWFTLVPFYVDYVGSVTVTLRFCLLRWFYLAHLRSLRLPPAAFWFTPHFYGLPARLVTHVVALPFLRFIFTFLFLRITPFTFALRWLVKLHYVIHVYLHTRARFPFLLLRWLRSFCCFTLHTLHTHTLLLLFLPFCPFLVYYLFTFVCIFDLFVILLLITLFYFTFSYLHLLFWLWFWFTLLLRCLHTHVRFYLCLHIYIFGFLLPHLLVWFGYTFLPHARIFGSFYLFTLRFYLWLPLFAFLTTCGLPYLLRSLPLPRTRYVWLPFYLLPHAFGWVGSALPFAHTHTCTFCVYLCTLPRLCVADCCYPWFILFALYFVIVVVIFTLFTLLRWLLRFYCWFVYIFVVVLFIDFVCCCWFVTLITLHLHYCHTLHVITHLRIAHALRILRALVPFGSPFAAHYTTLYAPRRVYHARALHARVGSTCALPLPLRSPRLRCGLVYGYAAALPYWFVGCAPFPLRVPCALPCGYARLVGWFGYFCCHPLHIAPFYVLFYAVWLPLPSRLRTPPARRVTFTRSYCTRFTFCVTHALHTLRFTLRYIFARLRPFALPHAFLPFAVCCYLVTLVDLVCCIHFIFTTFSLFLVTFTLVITFTFYCLTTHYVTVGLHFYVTFLFLHFTAATFLPFYTLLWIIPFHSFGLFISFPIPSFIHHLVSFPIQDLVYLDYTLIIKLLLLQEGREEGEEERQGQARQAAGSGMKKRRASGGSRHRRVCGK